MTIRDNDVRLLPEGHEGSAQRAREASPDVVTDVRSTVELQFRQMEQDHDRIRAQELAARLAEQMIN